MARVCALVPARGGSKGLPGKNLRPLAGTPLYRRAVDQARAAGIGEIAISTDIEAILTADHPPGTRAFRRPADLAGDTVPMDPVMINHLTRHGPADATMVLLQPTSPLRSVAQITEALALFATGRFDLVMSVTDIDRGILKAGLLLDDGRFRAVNDPAFPFTNRQALPRVCIPNGAIYVFNTAWFLRNGGFATDNTGALEMSAEASIDIDTAEDFALCESILAKTP